LRPTLLGRLGVDLKINPQRNATLTVSLSPATILLITIKQDAYFVSTTSAKNCDKKAGSFISDNERSIETNYNYKYTP